MNLLFLVSNRHFRGGSYSVMKFAQALSYKGHKVFLVCTHNPPFEDPNELKFIKRPSIPLFFKGAGLLDKIFCHFYDYWILNSLIIKENIDCILGVQIDDTVRAVKLARRNDCKVANFVFESPEWLKHIWKDFKFGKRFEKEWNSFKKALYKSDTIIAISYSTKKYVEKWLSQEVKCVALPGIDQEIADAVPGQNKENQIIFVGALEERKNIGDVIFALSKIKNRPKFVICGEGNLKPTLTKLARKFNVDCEFKGKVNEYAKWKEIRKSLFMVFPSSFEGFGMPPAEALYAKIPCIASDLEILRENYGNKLEYFPVHNIDTLAEKIRFLLENPQYRVQRGKEGYSYIKERFSWEKSAEEIEKCVK